MRYSYLESRRRRRNPFQYKDSLPLEMFISPGGIEMFEACLSFIQNFWVQEYPSCAKAYCRSF